MDNEQLDQLAAFLRDRVGDDLRSITHYDFDTREYEIVYGRADVMELYSEDTIDKIVQSYETDSLGKTVEESRYQHGDLNCIVRCFDGGIEINLVEDGAGVVIGLEAETFLTQNTFIGRCMEIVGFS